MQSPPLGRLVGEPLSAVVFVQDYVQLQFGGPWPQLTAFVWPVISIGGDQLVFGMPGYRDALCACIGEIVSHSVVSDEPDEIRIDFRNGAVLTVSLDERDRDGPEAALFRSDDSHDMWVL